MALVWTQVSKTPHMDAHSDKKQCMLMYSEFLKVFSFNRRATFERPHNLHAMMIGDKLYNSTIIYDTIYSRFVAGGTFDNAELYARKGQHKAPVLVAHTHTPVMRIQLAQIERLELRLLELPMLADFFGPNAYRLLLLMRPEIYPEMALHAKTYIQGLSRLGIEADNVAGGTIAYG